MTKKELFEAMCDNQIVYYNDIRYKVNTIANSCVQLLLDYSYETFYITDTEFNKIKSKCESCLDDLPIVSVNGLEAINQDSKWNKFNAWIEKYRTQLEKIPKE